MLDTRLREAHTRESGRSVSMQRVAQEDEEAAYELFKALRSPVPCSKIGQALAKHFALYSDLLKPAPRQATQPQRDDL